MAEIERFHPEQKQVQTIQQEQTTFSEIRHQNILNLFDYGERQIESGDKLGLEKTI